LGKLNRVTSSQLLKNNKSATNLALEITTKNEVASFKKKVPEPIKVTTANSKPSPMTPLLKSTISPRTATTASEFSTRTKYAQGGKLTKLSGEMTVSRMLDFGEPNTNKPPQPQEGGSSRLQ